MHEGTQEWINLGKWLPAARMLFGAIVPNQGISPRTQDATHSRHGAGDASSRLLANMQHEIV